MGESFDSATLNGATWWSEGVHEYPMTWRGYLGVLYVRATVGLLRLIPSGDLSSPDYDWGRFRTAIERVESLISHMPREILRQPSDCESLRGEWFVPKARTDTARTLLYVHGGSFVLPRGCLHDGLAADLARAAEARVLALDYRLAPEHPFPAAIDDVAEAYLALLEQGIDAETLAVVGDSAGGGLALAALLELRDEGVPLPAAFVAISPWADLTLSAHSIIANARADPFMSDAEYISVFAELYLQGAAAEQPLASPALADLHGLCDTLVHVGSTDMLYDDSRRIVEGIRAAGGRAQLEVWRNMPHVWQRMSFIPEAECSLDAIGRFLRRRVG